MKNLESKKSAESEVDNSTTELRRDFLKKFGKYSVGVPAVAFTLMSPNTSKAVGSASDGDGDGSGA